MGQSNLKEIHGQDTGLQYEAKFVAEDQSGQIRSTIGQLTEYRYFDVARPSVYEEKKLREGLVCDREPSK